MNRGKLAVRGVRKVFGDHVVLRSVDLDVEPGQCVVLIGASFWSSVLNKK